MQTLTFLQRKCISSDANVLMPLHSVEGFGEVKKQEQRDLAIVHDQRNIIVDSKQQSQGHDALSIG